MATETVIGNIVFTKDRPLQLEAYLRSLHEYCPSSAMKTYILYKAHLFDEEYAQVFAAYPQCTVIRERDFYRDMMNLLDAVTTEYVLFGVDDVVYFDSIDLDVVIRTFEAAPADVFGFTLRFGREMIIAGGDSPRSIAAAGQTVFGVDWTTGKTPSTRYPFELCATVYPASLVKRILHDVTRPARIIDVVCPPLTKLVRSAGKAMGRKNIPRRFGLFYDPNTFESWMCRWCQKHAGQVPSLLCFQKICASAVQVNIVNTSTDNEFDGSPEHSIEELAAKYRAGYRMNIDFVRQSRPTGTHCGRRYFRLEKMA